MRRLVRRMAGAESEPGQPRGVGRVGDVVGDEADGLVGQVLAQVVAAREGPGRGDRGIVAHQLRRVLVGLCIHEAIEAVEAAAQRPAVERSGRPGLGQRGHVPLADHVVAVAVCPQDLGQRAGRCARSCRDSRDSRSRNWPGSRRRPSGGCAPSAAPRAWSSTWRWCGSRCSAAPRPRARRCRRRDRRAVAAEVGKADVVEQHDQDIRRAVRRAGLRPATRAWSPRRSCRSSLPLSLRPFAPNAQAKAPGA